MLLSSPEDFPYPPSKITRRIEYLKHTKHLINPRTKASKALCRSSMCGSVHTYQNGRKHTFPDRANNSRLIYFHTDVKDIKVMPHWSQFQHLHIFYDSQTFPLCRMRLKSNHILIFQRKLLTLLKLHQHLADFHEFTANVNKKNTFVDVCIGFHTISFSSRNSWIKTWQSWESDVTWEMLSGAYC